MFINSLIVADTVMTEWSFLLGTLFVSWMCYCIMWHPYCR